MAGILAGDDLATSLSRRSSSMRISLASVSTKSWASAGVREAFTVPGGDVFQRSGRDYNDEDELMWAALERLPTYDRLRKGIMNQVSDSGRVVREEIDVANLGTQRKKQLMESIFKVVEEDNEKFLQRLRNRTDR